MSIPKEPRQLMINIMYLVLMALLALNVSAEVMNAFQTLDEGNQASMDTVDKQTTQTAKDLTSLLDDDSKAKFRPILATVTDIRAQVSQFNAYVKELHDNLIDEAGNQNGELDEDDYVTKKGIRSVRGKKNKDVTTRILVYGDDGVVEGQNGKGDELKDKIIETRQAIIDRYTELLNTYGKDFDLNESDIAGHIQSDAVNMPFSVDDETWKSNDKKVSWADFKFGHMPVAAVLPLMSQIQSDLKVSEANIVNALRQMAGGKVVEVDNFFPVFEADRSYVIGGERLTAKVSVGAFSSALDPGNVVLRANGTRLPIGADGKADFSVLASGTGPKTINLDVAVTNPLTGETKTGTNTFTYEVGTRSVSVAADKMNVFYMGVENPITVSAAGVNSADVRVNISGDAKRKSGSGSKFIVTGSKVGTAKVNVTANGQTLGSFDFRVKRIPDPVAKVGGSRGGRIKSTTFKVQTGLYAELENFDFGAKCIISGFELMYAPKGRDVVPSINAGGNYTPSTLKLVKLVKPGDRIFISNIKARCPGDTGPRPLGTMNFEIN
jgi:gliding motility-associated protein GldM